MNTPLLIARKMAGDASPTQRVMTRIATSAVAVSICVMIITLAIVGGFKREMTRLVEATSAEITLTNPRTLDASFGAPVGEQEQLLALVTSVEGCTAAEPYALRGCVARSEHGVAAVMLKGVSAHYPSERFDGLIDEGSFPAIGEQRRKELLIARQTAEALGVKVGERVELLFMEEDQMPRRELFKVAGIYAMGGNEQAALAITDLRNVRKINGWTEEQFSGIEISTDKRQPTSNVVYEINRRLIYDYEGEQDVTAIEARELYDYIFSWLDTHDVNAAVIGVIMFIVTLFNMVTALLILVLERTRMVGILKSLGMSTAAVRRIFLYRAAIIIGKGLLIGNALGLALITLQHTTAVVKLDRTAYYVSSVPVAFDGWGIATVNTLFAAAILLLLYAATAIVARISPAEAVKYE